MQNTHQLKELSNGQTQSEFCPICGKELVPYLFTDIGRPMLMPVVCECYHMQQKEADELESKIKKRQKIWDIFQQGKIGERLTNATFENFQQLSGTEVAFEEALKYVEKKLWQKNKGLMIFGPNGNGKSHLIASINNAIKKEIISVLLNIDLLMAIFQSTFREEYSETELLNSLSEVDVCLLNDLGAEQLTDWSRRVIYSVINTLYEHKKCLIISTNLHPNELRSWVGNRTFDRITEMCKIVENNGQSYRFLQAKKYMDEIHN